MSESRAQPGIQDPELVVSFGGRVQINSRIINAKVIPISACQMSRKHRTIVRKAIKGTQWMPRHLVPKKDVLYCEKLR